MGSKGHKAKQKITIIRLGDRGAQNSASPALQPHHSGTGRKETQNVNSVGTQILNFAVVFHVFIYKY